MLRIILKLEQGEVPDRNAKGWTAIFSMVEGEMERIAVNHKRACFDPLLLSLLPFLFCVENVVPTRR